MNKLKSFFSAIWKWIKGALSVFHRYVPKFFYVFPALAVICAILHLICNYSIPFADLMIEKICAPVRFVLAKATGWVPFSVGELHTDGMITLTPAVHGTDGFFVAKMQKGY